MTQTPFWVQVTTSRAPPNPSYNIRIPKPADFASKWTDKPTSMHFEVGENVVLL